MSLARRVLLAASAIACAVVVAPGAHAQDASPIPMAPPLAPFKRGPMFEGTAGVYAPSGALARVSAPGPWLRLSVGWDFTRWLSVFGTFDGAFLATDRAPPPPGSRAYVLWGFGGGARVSIGVTDRVRIPLRVDVSAHEVDDDGVLAVYGFDRARDLGLSYGGTTGLEWRAASRHFGLILEGGVRRDTALESAWRGGGPLAIVAGLGIHYTL